MGSQNSLHINDQNQYPGGRPNVDGSQGGFAGGNILDQIEQLQMVLELIVPSFAIPLQKAVLCEYHLLVN